MIENEINNLETLKKISAFIVLVIPFMFYSTAFSAEKKEDTSIISCGPENDTPPR